MENLKNHRTLIKQFLCEYERLSNLRATPGVEKFVVFDEVRDHYFLIRLGWSEERRVRQLVVYVRLKDGKIWVEEDWTETGIATDLLSAGIPKEDIVLAFQPPEMRNPSEFALA